MVVEQSEILIGGIEDADIREKERRKKRGKREEVGYYVYSYS